MSFWDFASLILHLDLDAPGAGLGGGHLGVGERLDAAAFEVLLELGRNRFVLARHQPGEELDKGDLAPVALEDRRELDTDRAASHDRDALRDFVQVNGFVAEDDLLAVNLDPGNAARRRAGGNHQLLRCGQRLLVTILQGHLDVLASGQARGALDPVDLVLLEEHLDAAGKAGDHLVLARVHGRHVNPHAGGIETGEAPLLGRLRDLERVGVLEQCLGRNAAPDEARAAERLLLFHDRHLEAELRRANGTHVATRPGPDYHDIGPRSPRMPPRCRN